MWSATEVTRDKWEAARKSSTQTNLLQSWEYGQAICESKGCKCVRLILSDNEGNSRAMVQVLTKVIPVIGGIARINRGPLWISSDKDEKPTLSELGYAIDAIKKEARRRRWWQLRMALEWPDSDDACKQVESTGLSRVNAPASASHLLDLRQTVEQLHAGLHGKWRNLLRKAEKNNLVVTDGINEERLAALINAYDDLQKTKGFSGLPSSLVRLLSNQFGQAWQLNIYTAQQQDSENEFVGYLVSVIHGDTATYLIGINADEGRRLQANYLLLWRAIIDAKNKGCTWFDLGGINEETPKGIAHFKSGLKGDPYQLIGEWRWSLWQR